MGFLSMIIFQDLQSRSTMAWNEKKEEFAASVANLASAQSEMKSKNREMKKQFETSQQRVLDLSTMLQKLRKRD